MHMRMDARAADMHMRMGPWDVYTCASAEGHLECLRYAHENGCPWDVYTCRSAGHLECLRYAHENGCPWDEETLRVSSR